MVVDIGAISGHADNRFIVARRPADEGDIYSDVVGYDDKSKEDRQDAVVLHLRHRWHRDDLDHLVAIYVVKGLTRPPEGLDRHDDRCQGIGCVEDPQVVAHILVLARASEELEAEVALIGDRGRIGEVVPGHTG